MLPEILSSVFMGGIAATAYYHRIGGGDNEHPKIQRIASNCGLVSKDGKEIRIYRKSKKEGCTEYVYQMPQGLSFKDFENKLDHFQDGLNIKRSALDLSISDIKKIELSKNPIPQVKKLLNKKRKLRKEVEIEFDGMIKFRVYQEPLTDFIPFDEEILKRCKGWEVPTGLNRAAEMIKHDFEKYPHLALGGATRYGKSNFLNMLISTLVCNQSENVTFTLIDLKGGVEFGDYENMKQVKNIAYEPQEALEALEKAYNDMRAMQARLRASKFKKVQDAGFKQRHFVIIDEVGELNPAEAVNKEERKIKEQCQMYMSQIARLGAGLGFRQILATQYPTGDVIPRQCKQNSDAKLSFRVRNATASRVVLDEEGAETLPFIRGRAIYLTDRKHVIQTPFIEGDFIQKTIEPHINIRPRKQHERGDKVEKFHSPTREKRNGDTLHIG